MRGLRTAIMAGFSLSIATAYLTFFAGLGIGAGIYMLRTLLGGL